MSMKPKLRSDAVIWQDTVWEVQAVSYNRITGEATLTIKTIDQRIFDLLRGMRK